MTSQSTNLNSTNRAVIVGSDGRIQAVGEADALINANPGVEVKRLENRQPLLEESPL